MNAQIDSIFSDESHSLAFGLVVQGAVARCRRQFRGDHDLAMIASIGVPSASEFEHQGDGHVAVLQYHGLRDGMSIYDLGCGSGRTAMAPQRSSWKGRYKGTDIVKSLADYLQLKCPGYEAIIHRDPTIATPDTSLDIIFHRSVFTHLHPEQC